jgi:hypothetical protein
MINHHIHAALARERRGTLLAEAEAARPARQARPRRPRAGATAARKSRLSWPPRWLRPAWRRLLSCRPRSAPAGKQIALRDGSRVLIRRVHSADAPLLADGFARPGHWYSSTVPGRLQGRPARSQVLRSEGESR